MIRVLILGSKEYPFGTNRGDDPIPSGGMETYVNDLAPALSRLCELHIVTRRFRGTPKSEKIGGRISVSRVPWVRGKWLRNPSFNIMSFLHSLRIGRDPDIFYSNGIVSGFFGMVLGKLFRKKSVYRPAGIGFVQFGFPVRSVMFALERLVFSRSSAVVFHSAGEKRNAQEKFKLDLANGHVILTGFPVHKFKAGSVHVRKDFGIGDETVISAVSRFVPVKGLEHLIRACSELDPGFRLLLVGSGPEEEKLRRLSRQLGMEERVVFTGFRHDIPDILAISDIFVVSSMFEGLPTSLLEAMAAGKACIVTDIGLPVRHMETGLVVKPGDSFAIRNAIQALMNNRELRKRLGNNARRFVEAECTPEKAARRHMHVFMRLVSGGDESGPD